MTRDFHLNAPYESEINYFNQALLWAAFISFIPQGKTNILGCDAERTQRETRRERRRDAERDVEGTRKERGRDAERDVEGTRKGTRKERRRDAEESGEDDATSFTSRHLFT